MSVGQVFAGECGRVTLVRSAGDALFPILFRVVLVAREIIRAAEKVLSVDSDVIRFAVHFLVDCCKAILRWWLAVQDVAYRGIDRGQVRKIRAESFDEPTSFRNSCL